MGIETYQQCWVCSKGFCGKCIVKADFGIPEHLKHSTFKDTNPAEIIDGQPKKKSDKSGWICKDMCRLVVVETLLVETAQAVILLLP